MVYLLESRASRGQDVHSFGAIHGTLVPGRTVLWDLGAEISAVSTFSIVHWRISSDERHDLRKVNIKELDKIEIRRDLFSFMASTRAVAAMESCFGVFSPHQPNQQRISRSMQLPY